MPCLNGKHSKAQKLCLEGNDCHRMHLAYTGKAFFYYNPDFNVIRGAWYAGGVAAIVAALLRDGTAPEGLGPVRCCVISPAAVFSGDLSEACRPFITSLILRSGSPLHSRVTANHTCFNANGQRGFLYLCHLQVTLHSCRVTLSIPTLMQGLNEVGCIRVIRKSMSGLRGWFQHSHSPEGDVRTLDFQAFPITSGLFNRTYFDAGKSFRFAIYILTYLVESRLVVPPASPDHSPGFLGVVSNTKEAWVSS